jgi:hypothetical protein
MSAFLKSRFHKILGMFDDFYPAGLPGKAQCSMEITQNCEAAHSVDLRKAVKWK